MSDILNKMREERERQTQAQAKTEPKKETKPKKAKTVSKKAEEITTEKRDKRVQIVLTQSLYDQLIETRFKRKNKSVNETVIRAITEYIERSK